MLQLAKDCAIYREIEPNKMVTINQGELPYSAPQSRLNYVYHGYDGFNKFCYPIAPSETKFFSGSKGGKLFVFTELRMSFDPSFDKTNFYVGINTGDVQNEDFNNPLGFGAKLVFSQSEQGKTKEITPFSDSDDLLILSFYPGVLGNSWLFEPKFRINKNLTGMVNLKVDEDDNGVPKIEKAVWIHVFDHFGNLKGIIKKNGNQGFDNLDFDFNMERQYKILPLISFNKVEESGKDHYMFDVGDPKRDADVEITEE